MKRIIWISLATVVILLLFARCDHSTNSQAPPVDADLSITRPVNQSWVEGSVTITVQSPSILPSMVEFYVDGDVIARRTSSPWETTWDTRELAPNSYHTLKARAFSASGSYKTSSEVVVRIK